ncbi:MAG: Hsp20/alpha crystallin family protein [Candidatus Omnitrophica bacterium]|nr:Hsp20/alpha crystallin family protein [Candidatus Omnitrophota bacterium]
MDLIRRDRDLWDPFDIVSDLQREMNRIFNRSITSREGWTRGFQPSIEVEDENDHFVLRADAPGLKKEDFSISIQGNHLTLKGERKVEKENKGKGYYYSERSYGAFARTFEFPAEIQADKAKANYKDGVLEVILPKSESSKPKQINVEIK